ncbi:putative receptor tyrosine-protein kinase erbB-4-like, partial [Triplophysa rosa]
MALAKFNLDLPSPVLGPLNLLWRPVVQPGDFQIPSCPDFTDVVFSAFRAAPSSRPDHVARTLAGMAEAQERGLGSMLPVESYISSVVVSPDEALKQELLCPNPECWRTDDLLVRTFNTVSGLTRVGNSMAHLLLVLHSTRATTASDNTSLELLDASLQALGSVAFSSGKALRLITQTRRQVWLAQSKLPEAYRNSLCRLPLVPGQVFGPAAQEALERRAAESRSQHVGRTASYMRHAREELLSSVPSQTPSEHSGVFHGGPGPSPGPGPGPFRGDTKSVEEGCDRAAHVTPCRRSRLEGKPTEKLSNSMPVNVFPQGGSGLQVNEGHSDRCQKAGTAEDLGKVPGSLQVSLYQLPTAGRPSHGSLISYSFRPVASPASSTLVDSQEPVTNSHVGSHHERLFCRSEAMEDSRVSSERAAHIPGRCNNVADSLSRSVLRPGEWRLHEGVVDSLWEIYGTAAIDLFASRVSTHCPLWFSAQKEQGSLGQDALAHEWPNLLLYAFPTIHSFG